MCRLEKSQGGKLPLNFKILIVPGAELSTQFLGVNVLQYRTIPFNVSIASSTTFFSAANSTRVFNVTFPFTVSRENFDVV